MVSTVPCTFKDCLCIIYDKEWELEKETKVNSEVLLIKSSGIILIFTCILSDYMAHDSSKKFLKNIHFANMTASFLLRCQNLLWYFTPEMMYFQP